MTNKILKRKPLALILAGITASLFSSWVQSATPPDTLVVAKNIEDVITLDPAEAYENSTSEILNNAYSRLVRRDPKNPATIEGDVASTWKVSDDGKTFTFTIRPNEHFPSGRAITADDAVYSLRRVILLNKTPSFLLKTFGWDSKNILQNVYSDGNNVVVHIADSIASDLVLQILASAPGSVLDAKLLEEHTKNNDYGNGWLRTAWAGSGPFSIQTWQPKQAIVLERNPTYFGDKAHLARIIFRHVADSSTQALLLEKGDVDVANNLQPDQLTKLLQNKHFTTVDTLRFTQIYMPLNQTDVPLQNVKVRKALKWLIDYQGIEKNLLQGQWVEHQSFISIGQPGALTENPFHLDVARARKLLDEAGYKNGFDLRMDVENAAPYPDIAQSIQSTFAQAGIRLKLVTSDRRQIVTEYRERKHQTILWHASGSYNDPYVSASDFAYNVDNSANSTNRNRAWRSNWINNNINQLTDKALHERDKAKRIAEYQQLQREMWKVAPFIHLFQQKERLAINTKVKNLITGPSDSTLYDEAIKQ
ncbi:ABC transporter substrate-binding protein [Pantoea sp. DY-17]|uniref:ABC transporter substrate-binding protein n=1 Tax=Pantoea sp. DY-17 TaxID=2871490 RepID=UPI001C96509C|nr:ABC transporter substrate-binding protein [Pantoea sp. DY-17]MBY4954564.1 ABC transporter substrate-binding protein [Pantoea sp. DY-17]